MINETISFVLTTEDQCSINLSEGNHGLVCVIPTITLSKPRIPPTLFQDVIDHIISLDRDYIKKIYFYNVTIKYKIITFQLFGHIRAALKKELQRPLSYEELKTSKDDYKWMESEFLPKFPEDLDQDMTYLEKRIKNMYWAFKRGKMGNDSYVLPDEYQIKYNYFFDIDPTDIKPVFEVYVNTKEPTTDGDRDEVIQKLLGKFGSLNVNLVFGKT